MLDLCNAYIELPYIPDVSVRYVDPSDPIPQPVMHRLKIACELDRGHKGDHHHRIGDKVILSPADWSRYL